jgi:hypothetical protein
MGAASIEDQIAFEADALKITSISSIAIDAMNESVDAMKEANIERLYELTETLKNMSQALKALALTFEPRPMAPAAESLAASINMFVGGLEAYPDKHATAVLVKAGTTMFKTSIYTIKAGVEYVCNDEKLGREMMEEAARMQSETGKEVAEAVMTLIQ